MNRFKNRNVIVVGLVIFLMLVGGAAFVGAAPADCTNSSEITGWITGAAEGHVENCTADEAAVGMVAYGEFSDGSTQEIDRVTGTAPAGEITQLFMAVPDCVVKVILYKGDNDADPANQLARQTYNADKGNYCDQLPTPTPTKVPPTKTPPPPTPTTPPPTPTTPPPTPTAPPNGGQGCTPGYWRQTQHFDSWVNYSPTDLYDVVFGVDGSFETLLDAVWARGGQENALARHAVAALLNAANSDVSYAYTEAEVIAMVQSAYASGDFNTIKNLFEVENESGCPLN